MKFGGDQFKQRATMEALPGEQVIFGATTIENTGNSSARITGARLVGDVEASAADISAVRIVSLGKVPGDGDLLGAATWPERGWKKWWDDAAPVGKVELSAGDAAELVFLVDVKKAGDWIWPQTAVDYEINGSRYAAVTDFGFQICPPAPGK